MPRSALGDRKHEIGAGYVQIAPTDQDRGAAGRQLRQRFAQHLMERRESGHVVAAVEDDREWRSQPLVELLEIAAREYREPALV